ncbi:hypothetical protein E4U23_003880 [Claviceps purpurea]|nr:hypothetical protein E4U23_003880 [Claviceps purpurea]
MACISSKVHVVFLHHLLVNTSMDSSLDHGMQRKRVPTRTLSGSGNGGNILSQALFIRNVACQSSA